MNHIADQFPGLISRTRSNKAMACLKFRDNNQPGTGMSGCPCDESFPSTIDRACLKRRLCSWTSCSFMTLLPNTVHAKYLEPPLVHIGRPLHDKTQRILPRQCDWRSSIGTVAVRNQKSHNRSAWRMRECSWTTLFRLISRPDHHR